jgi:hypothetical protein
MFIHQTGHYGKGSDFDPTRFDQADANRRLDAIVRGAFGTV